MKCEGCERLFQLPALHPKLNGKVKGTGGMVAWQMLCNDCRAGVPPAEPEPPPPTKQYPKVGAERAIPREPGEDDDL